MAAGKELLLRVDQVNAISGDICHAIGDRPGNNTRET